MIRIAESSSSSHLGEAEVVVTLVELRVATKRGWSSCKRRFSVVTLVTF
jgi:hypothetical protein